MEYLQEEQIDKSNHFLKEILIFFLLMSILVFVGFVHHWNSKDLIVVPTFLFIAWYIDLFIHEFGHLIVGKSLGYQFNVFKIGVFTWKKVNGKIRFLVNSNQAPIAFCSMQIPFRKASSRFRYILYIMSGIIFSLAVGFILFNYFFVFKNKYEHNNIYYPNLFIFIMGVVSFHSALTNLIPTVTKNLPSDGKIIWGYLFKRPFAKKFFKLNAISSQLAQGIRPKDIELIMDEDSDDYRVELLAYYKAVDEHNLDLMVKYANQFEKKIETYSSFVLPTIYRELCYINCLLEKEGNATKYFKLLSDDNEEVNELRVKAYFAYYIEEDLDLAYEYCQKALEVSDKYINKGISLMEVDLIQTLLNKIKLKENNNT